MDNIVVADIGKSNFCKTRTLFRFNYGQRLKIVGVDLPPTYEVHFSNEVEGASKTQIGNEDGVLIPREYFEPGKSIFAWLFLHAAEDSGETVAQIIIPISNRAKITDEELLPEEESAISQAIVELNKAVTQTNADVEAADAAAESAAAAQIAAEAAQENAESARDIANASAAASSNSVDNALAYKNAAELAQQKAEQAQSKTETAEQNAEAAKEAARSSAATSVEAAQISINSATESAASAQTAASSAAAAQQSANEAKAYKNEAATKANEANASANAASTSKNNAEAAALRAENAAQSAQTSANNAEANADAAAASSEQAASYKSEAQIAALNAQTAASNAQTYSNNAANSASDAAVASVAAVAAKNESEQIKADVKADATLVRSAMSAAMVAKTDAEAARDTAVSATVHSPKIEDGTWHVWNQQNDGYVDTNVAAQGPKGDKGDSYVLTEQDKADISTLVDSMKIHICTSQEYNSETGVPTIANPDTETFYLVPGGEGNNLFIEWAYVNGTWERFGSADVDLSNYVQKTDYATANEPGVIRVGPGSGLSMEAGVSLAVMGANSSEVKTGTNPVKPIVPNKQHQSVFYGLAKAAGDTTQSQSSNAVGTYTDEAKAAIQQMLDVPSTGDIPDTSIYATKADTVLETTLSMGRKAETTVGLKSVAMGLNVVASGKCSHGEGVSTIASATASHAEGSLSKAIGPNSHTEGYITEANHVNTHAEGYHTKANGGYSRVSGKYNVPDNLDDINDWVPSQQYEVGDKVKKISFTSGTDLLNIFICTQANNDEEFDYSKWQARYEYHYADIIGNGTADDARSNAYALDWDGDGHYAGDVYVHANADSTGGTKLATIEDIPDAPVQDVQINGVSVLTDRVANLPMITSTSPGIAKVDQYSAYGINVRADGTLQVVTASDAQIKSGSIGNDRRPITPANQHSSIFYGLAKAAGADEKNSTLPVGQYTDTAKSAIRTMLGAASDNIIAISDTAPTDPDTKIWIPETATSVQVPTVSEMETALAEKVGDVQVNGTSIVSDGVADIPIASPSNFGVVMSASGYGTKMQSNGVLSTAPATDAQVKKGVLEYNVIGPLRQHLAIFYGLSKAAGVDLANETVTLGTYPEASKTAIKQMLGVEEGLKVVRLI